jgi:putative spermidine/putrescine transport system permease protein
MHARRSLSAVPAARWSVVIGLAPLVLFFLITVGTGIIHGFFQSLALAGPPRFVRESSGSVSLLHGYRYLFGETDFLLSAGYTVYIALVTAILAVTIGAVMAYMLWCAPERIRRTGGIYRLPIILPHIVVAFLTILFWSGRGVMATTAAFLGMDSFPDLLYAPGGSGIILGYVYKEFPFVMLLVLAVLQRIPERYVLTARMLGASPVRIFFRVILPLIIPVLNQLFIILFLYALGGFDIPWLLGSSRPRMIPMTVYSLYFQGNLSDRAAAAAALSLLTVFAALFVVIYSRSVRKLSARERAV